MIIPPFNLNFEPKPKRQVGKIVTISNCTASNCAGDGISVVIK